MKGCFTFIRFLFLLLFLVAIQWVSFPIHPVYAANNTYYVAKNGSDNNPGSLAQPWLTIQKAASTMVAGDTVNIQAGTYNEKVSPANSGNAGSPITYQTYGSGSVILDGTGKATGSTGVFDIENKNYITLKGIQIQSSNFAGAFVYGTSDHIVLQDLTIHNTGISGICAVSSGWSTPCTVTNLTIDGCTIYATNSTANQEMISLTAVNGFEIKNCVVHDPIDTNRVGIDVKVGSGNGSIHHNEVYNTGAGSNNIYVDAAGKDTSNISIYNNNVHSGHGAGIVVNDERGGATVSNIHIYNNLLTGNLRGIAINNSGQSSSVYSNIIIDFNTLYNNGSMSEIWFLTSKISNSAVRNNLIYNTSGATLLSGVPGGVTSDHNLTSNPQFVSTTDSHLRSTSPAINAASSVNAPTTDFAGNARPQGSGYDIGAYEYGSSGGAVLDHITVSPSDLSVTVGGSVSYAAQGYDSSNNPISGLTYSWSVNNPAAGSISSGGVFTAGVTTGSYPDVVQATSGDKTATASVTLTERAVLDHITVSPSSASVRTGGNQSYTAQGYDSSNNPISGLTYTWSVIDPAAGSISSGGVFTAGVTTGSYPDVVQATSGNKTATASVTVTIGTLDHITISPSNPSVTIRGSVSYAAQGYDSNNNLISGLTYTWSVSNPAAGSISSGGVFTGGATTGRYRNVIRAASGGKTGTASVTITIGSLDHITVSPSDASVEAGGNQTYTAQGYDSGNNPISGLAYTWSVSNPAAGSISPSGVFTAGTVAGSYPDVILATASGKTGTVSLTITQPYPVWDIDKDGIVNVQDIILINQHMDESGSPGWIKEDVNGDGIIDVLDMIMIIQHLSQ